MADHDADKLNLWYHYLAVLVRLLLLICSVFLLAVPVVHVLSYYLEEYVH